MVLHFQSQRILGCWVYLHDFSKNDVNKQQQLTLMTSARLISTDSSMSNMTWQRGEHGFVQTVRPQILSSPLLDQPQRVARFSVADFASLAAVAEREGLLLQRFLSYRALPYSLLI